jgi:heme A synthase
VTGRLPAGMFEVMELAHRYQARVTAYVWLLTAVYPWFQEEAAGSQPPAWGIHIGVQPIP